MSIFTVIVILSALMIIGGISMMTTPLTTFISAGYCIVFLFFVWGIFGIIRGISEKRYDKEFLFSILSLILGVVGCVVPGAAQMNNYLLLYLAAGWFIVHGILTIIDAIDNRKQGGETIVMVIGIILGVLELIMGVYSIAPPTILAISLGFLIGFYFIESGINAIIIGSSVCKGGNNMTVFFTFMGVLTIIGGISLLVTPLMTFLSAGDCIIMLFFVHGVIGIIRGLAERRFNKEFFFAILSLILGIIGSAIPGVAEMNNHILLYIAAGWFIVHGILTIVNAIENKKKNGESGTMVIGIILGILEVVMGIYSAVHPTMLAIGLGVLISIYFIEYGANMIFIGSEISKAVAAENELESFEAR